MAAGYSHVHLIPHLEGLDQRREIGRGSFGAVYEVKMNGLPCIAKGLHDILLGCGGNLPVREADKEAIRAKFHDECALLGNLKHPNIVQFLGVHRSKDNDEWLMMEYLHMDLAKCLEMYPDIPLPLKLSILRDVSYGLLHLHSQAPPIIHRDLTAPNILLTQGMSAKIADLGVSKIFDIRQIQRSAHTAAPGTLAYMPPEALSPDPKYDTKLDVFSYGVLTLYVANQEFPTVYELQILPLVTTKQEIQICKRMPWVDKMGVAHPLHNVVMSCLMDRPDHRPTSKELNDIITKLCTQHEDSCNNILEANERQEKELAEVRREMERVVASKDEEIAQLQLQSKELETLEKEVQTKNQQVKQYKKQVDSYKAELEKCQAALQQNKVLLEEREKELEGCRGSQNEADVGQTPVEKQVKDIEAMCQRGIEEIEAVLLEKEQRYCVNLEKVKRYYKKQQQEVGARPDSGSCTHDEEAQGVCTRGVAGDEVKEKKVELASKGKELASVAVLEEELQTKNQQVKQYKKQVDSYKAELEKSQAALQQACALPPDQSTPLSPPLSYRLVPLHTMRGPQPPPQVQRVQTSHSRSLPVTMETTNTPQAFPAPTQQATCTIN